MSKNIIVCCDGTNNKLTISENTNVINLIRCLKKDEGQMAYYSPGVGTLGPDGLRGWFKKNSYRFRDLVSAISLEKNVRDAYVFLMNHYKEGDKIFLFGFSRGAYTVRMLAGVIHLFGLMHVGNDNHLRYIVEIYSKQGKQGNSGKKGSSDFFRLAGTFKAAFSNDVNIHFMGIWDTVVSVGGIFKPYIDFPYTYNLEHTRTVRHAVAIDERRKHFKFSPVKKDGENDVQEVFFAGVHSDVGGSYPEEESGLSKIALEWMLAEASKCGLLLNDEKVDDYVYGTDKKYHKPDYKQEIHNSLSFKEKLIDLVPRLKYKKGGWFFEANFDFSLWPLRELPNDALVHSSVFEKLKNTAYQPGNFKLTNTYTEVKSGKIITC